MKELYLNYGYSPDKEAVDRSLELIASNLDNVVSDEVIRDCFSFMDLTSLHNADSVESISALMQKVNTYRDTYQNYPLPASVCVGGEENVICDRIFSGCPGWNYWRDRDCAGVQ